MRVAGMPQTLPVVFVRGGNTLWPHQQPITGHTPLTHTHTEGTFSASAQPHLHVWLWEERVLDENTEKRRARYRASSYTSVRRLTSGNWSTEWDGRTKSNFTGRIQTYICQRSNKDRNKDTGSDVSVAISQTTEENSKCQSNVGNETLWVSAIKMGDFWTAP